MRPATHVEVDHIAHSRPAPVASGFALGYTTSRTCDANGNLRTYRDASNNVTTFSYDSLNREIEREDALGNSLTYAYDTRNRLTSQTDRLGRRKDFTYDDAGRVLSETWVNNGGGTANLLTYTYDDNGNVLSAADYDGSYALAYDNQDRLESQTGLYGVSLTFAYDAMGRRERVEDSFGGVLSSVYDAGGQLIERQFSNGTATFTYERDYTDSGQVLEARRYSDLTSTTLVGSTTFGYDAAHNVTSIQHKDGSETNLAAYTYSYDAGHRITEEKRNGTSVTYSYDTTSQLTQAGSATYSYDQTGNRTMAGYVTDPMNQLKNDGTFTYTYDLEGNVSTKSKGSGLEKWYYSYDHNNRLTSIRKTSDGTTNTLTVTYAYDVFGNRVKEDKWRSGPGLVTTKFVYVGQEVHLDLDNSNAVLVRYIQGDGADEWIARVSASNVVEWYLTERQGSIRDIVDAGGAVVDSITYDGVGKIVSESTPGYLGRFGYVGMGYDSDTGLNTTPHRDYDPAVARWLTQDPILFQAGDANIYRYVGNNFTNATDPSGLVQDLALGATAVAAEETIFGSAYADAAVSWLVKRGVVKLVPVLNVASTIWDGYQLSSALFPAASIAPGGSTAPIAPAVPLQQGPDVLPSVLSPGMLAPIGQWRNHDAPIRMSDGTSVISTLGGGPKHLGFSLSWPLDRSEVTPTTVDVASVIDLALTQAKQKQKGACFAAGTPIRTPEGSTRIERIRVGDYVLSRSEYDLLGQVEMRQVEEVFIHTARVWVLRVGGQEIRTTEEHPFFVKGRGWLPAEELVAGDQLATEDGDWLTVEAVEDTGSEETVYNFRVADFATYFVGCDEWGFSVWAHNACVYRGISAQDVVTLAALQGISSTQPGAKDLEWQHIEEQNPAASDWISTTTSEKIARTKFGALGVVKIDLDLVPRWIDCSAGIPPKRPSTPAANQIAMGEKIVLVYQHIPQAAIEVLP